MVSVWFKMVTAVVPTASQVVAYRGTIVQVAWSVHVGLCITATLNAEEL
jgi:hypothetical protein